MAWRPQIERIDANVAGVLAGEVEFLASEKFTTKRVGITLDADLVDADVAGDKILKKGTVLGRVEDTGRYGPYDGAATDGREVAKGFLMESVNLKFGNAVTGLVIAGSVIADRCDGLDAGAKTDLRSFTFQ
jgi:hypothetical protein